MVWVRNNSDSNKKQGGLAKKVLLSFLSKCNTTLELIGISIYIPIDIKERLPMTKKMWSTWSFSPITLHLFVALPCAAKNREPLSGCLQSPSSPSIMTWSLRLINSKKGCHGIKQEGTWHVKSRTIEKIGTFLSGNNLMMIGPGRWSPGCFLEESRNRFSSFFYWIGGW